MVKHEDDVEIIVMDSPDLKNVKKQILIGPKDGYEGFMRMFTIGENGHTPYHSHDWYHLIYVVEGEGTAKIDEKDNKITKGSILYIPPNRIHGIKNTGTSDLRFLCLIPEKGGSY